MSNDMRLDSVSAQDAGLKKVTALRPFIVLCMPQLHILSTWSVFLCAYFCPTAVVQRGIDLYRDVFDIVSVEVRPSIAALGCWLVISLTLRVRLPIWTPPSSCNWVHEKEIQVQNYHDANFL